MDTCLTIKITNVVIDVSWIEIDLVSQWIKIISIDKNRKTKK